MKSRTVAIWLTLSIGGLAQTSAAAKAPADAIPSREARCFAAGPAVPVRPKQPPRMPPLAQVPNGTGVLFDVACTTAFVLPPVAGTVRAVELVANANVQHCPAMMSLQTALASSLEEMNAVEHSLATFLAGFDDLAAEVDALQQQVSAASTARADADAARRTAANGAAALETAADDAKVDLEMCTMLAHSENSCEPQTLALTGAKGALDSYRLGTLAPAEAAAQRAEEAYTQLFDIFSAKLAQMGAALDPIIELHARLDALNTSMLDSYRSYASLEGARGTLAYSVGWDSIVQSYRLKNTTAPWSWRPVPLSSVSFAASAVIAATPTSIPALLWFVPPGDSGSGSAPQPAGKVLAQSGSSVTAQIGLALTGACPYFSDGVATMETLRLDHGALAAHLVANFTYEYRVQVTPAYAGYLATSPLAVKIKKLSPTFDASAPGKLGALVRDDARRQAFKAETAAGAVARRMVAVVEAGGTLSFFP